jgi:MarR family transcriptional regulator, organic hydroperoxide resistance regulator
MAKNNREKSLGYAIGRTNWYIKTLLNKFLKEEGLSITNEQWIVLKVISANPDVSQTEIAEISLKDKTNITRILDLLEKSAYIKRLRDDRDRRMNRIHITQQGKKILKAVNPVTQKTDEICTHALNKKEVKELIKTLDAICIEIKDKL